MAMDQAETFEWLRWRSNRLDAVESQLTAEREAHAATKRQLDARIELLRQAVEYTSKQAEQIAALKTPTCCPECGSSDPCIHLGGGQFLFTRFSQGPLANNHGT